MVDLLNQSKDAHQLCSTRPPSLLLRQESTAPRKNLIGGGVLAQKFLQCAGAAVRCGEYRHR